MSISNVTFVVFEIGKLKLSRLRVNTYRFAIAYYFFRLFFYYAAN